MRLLVCIKQVPASSKVEVDPETGVLLRDGSVAKMNPYDLFALETAFRIRETVGGTVSVLTMGPPQAQKVIREAYAMGADRGAILSDRKFAGADVLATSYTLAQGIRKMGGFDLILCGKQTTDGDTAQVGAETSEFLHLPCMANIIRINEVNECTITITMDNGEECVKAKIALPCLLCVDKDIYVPRLPSYVKKKATADRIIEMISAADLPDADTSRFGLSGSPTQVRRIFPPEKNEKNERWEADPQTLADRAANLLFTQKWL